MFPCTAIMYWLGTQGDSRSARRDAATRGAAFSLRRFHGELLGYGSIPVPLVARMMTEAEPSIGMMAIPRLRALRRFARNDNRFAGSRASSYSPHVAHARSDAGRAGPSNALLIVGYDREPDTMNRYATHILEDIQSCVVEGLVTSDEKMNIVPVLAAEIPTLENGGVVLRPDGGMDVTWKLRPA